MRDFLEENLEEKIQQSLKLGVDPKELLGNRFLAREIVARNFSLFLRHGWQIDEAVKYLDLKTVAKNLSKLMDAGLSAEQAVTLMCSKDIALNVASLRERGLSDATIVDALSYDFVYKYFSALHKRIGIHVDLLLEKLDAKTVSANLKYLLQNGATMEALSKKLPVDIKTKFHLVLMYSTEPKEVIQEWFDAIEAEDKDEYAKYIIEEEKYLEFVDSDYYDDDDDDDDNIM